MNMKLKQIAASLLRYLARHGYLLTAGVFLLSGDFFLSLICVCLAIYSKLDDIVAMMEVEESLAETAAIQINPAIYEEGHFQ